MFFHDGSKNRGCEAIVRSAAHLLKDNGDIATLGLSSREPETDKIIPQLDVLHLDQHTAVDKFSLHGIRNAVNVKLFGNCLLYTSRCV